MRIHGTIYGDDAGAKPLRAWARDADDEDRLTPIELVAQGNRVLLRPVVQPDVIPVEATATPALAIPPQRSGPLDGNDFQ